MNALRLAMAVGCIGLRSWPIEASPSRTPLLSAHADLVWASSPIHFRSVATDRVELIDIGGRKLELLTRGQGSPALIIEAGMGVPGVEDAAWRAVIDEISKTNRVCIYDRAGLRKSDPATKLPRTSLDVAIDLNGLLAKAGAESIRKAREFLAGRTNPSSNPEQIDPTASESQVRAARDFVSSSRQI